MNRLQVVFTPDTKPTDVISPSGGALSQLSDSGQTLSEDSGVDIAESGHVSKDSSSHSTRTRHPRDTQGGGGDKPVRG